MPQTDRRFALRAGAVLTVAAAAALATAAPAFAHVTAQPGQAAQGGYAVVNFRVPDESDTAGTTKVVVNLPTDHPMTSVRVQPVAGWTVAMTTSAINPPVQVDGRPVSQAVTAITWTAAPGSHLGPGQYQDFPVNMGPMPTGVDSVAFPATQTYDNGDVVAWNEPTPAGGDEPEHPAPTVKLTPAVAGGDDDDDSSMAMGSPAAEPAAGGTDTTARWLGGAGLLVGALGLGVGAGAVMRSRKKASNES